MGSINQNWNHTHCLKDDVNCFHRVHGDNTDTKTDNIMKTENIIKDFNLKSKNIYFINNIKIL